MSIAGEDHDEMMEIILSNITNKIEFEGQQYYLLVKKQKSGSHCLLYLTDFSDNFWVKKLTPQYLHDLKLELKIRTNFKLFIQHLAYGLKQLTSIKQMEPKPALIVKLKITQGLQMSCKIKLDSCVNIEEKPAQFKSIMKVFGKQLYEAKQLQCKKAVKQVESVRKKQVVVVKNASKQQDLKLASKIFTKPPQARVIPEKYRDLINPTRKKRTGKGMKLVRPQSSQSDSQEQS